MASIKTILNFVKIGLFLILETPFRPRWAYYRVRGYAFHYVLNRCHQSRLSEYQSRKRPMTEALASVTRQPVRAVAAVLSSNVIKKIDVRRDGTTCWVVGIGVDADRTAASTAGRRGRGPIPIFYGPSPELIKIIYAVCRFMRPKAVVETGVARGFTSTGVLTALEENGSGRLYSVELPSLYIGYTRQVGELIPKHLRSRWSLELGPSAVVLPRLMKGLPPIDVFIQDSASNYDNQTTEYSIALGYMAPGGVLISNTLNNDAFVEMAESSGYAWAVIEQSKIFPIGILWKIPRGSSRAHEFLEHAQRAKGTGPAHAVTP